MDKLPLVTQRASLRQHLWILALLPYAWLVARYSHLIDDAFISFRYAHHWAIGEGLRFNLGSGTPVEGFSNFLWVALLALGERAGVAPETLAPVAGLACGIGVLAYVYRFALNALDLGQVPSLIAVVFLACFPPFAVWSTGGLETSAFALALFACWAELVRPQGPRFWLAALLALAIVSLRPEGLAWAVGLLLASYVGRGRDGTDMRLLKRYLVPFLVGFAVLLIARWSYFHDIVPNTVHAKGGLSTATILRGAKNAASYYLIFISPAVILALLPLAWRLPTGRLVISASLMFVAGTLWSLAVGGDWMPFFRFFAPLTPFLALLLGAIAAKIGRAGVLLAVPVIGLSLLPVFDVLLVPQSLREALYFRAFTQRGYETENARMQSGIRNGERYRTLGLALAQIAKPGDSLVQGAIGAVGYYSGITIYDRNGLVDREVARGEVSGVRSAGHDKLVPRVFFADRRPTWFEVRQIAPQSSKQQVGAWAAPVFRQLEEDKRLLDISVPEVIEFPGDGEDQPPFSLLLFRRVESKARARQAWRDVGLP